MTLNTTIGRGAQLALATAVTALSAAVVLLFSAGHAEQAHASMSSSPQLSAKAVALRTAMDKLWETTSPGRGW